MHEFDRIEVLSQLSTKRPGLRSSMGLLVSLTLTLVSEVAVAGYDVHITRKTDWSADAGPRITLTEWLEYVRTDPQVKGDPLNTKNDFVVTLGVETFPLWFDPNLGELDTKDPSDKALAKLVNIAEHLHARLQGDDGEFYPLHP
jgi:hypothetical protein